PDCGNCPNLYYDSRLGDGNHAQTSTNNLAWFGGRFRWRWRFARPSPAFPCKRWTPSRDGNVNPARVLLHLVGRIALFAFREIRCLAISDGRSTDALRRTTSFGYRRCDWRDSAFSSQFGLGLIICFVYLFSDHRSCGWIHCVHLAVTSL